MNIHAIIIIKYNNKYLQYYDKRWDSLLFLNTKLNEEFTDMDIINYVEKTLDKKVINCIFSKYIEHSKYSISHNEMRNYKHYFYIVKLDDYNVDNDYKYLSIEELENNKRAMEVNSDIINIVKGILI